MFAPLRQLLIFAARAIILTHLRDIHDVGVIHNDLEPWNVLHQSGEFRIIDFDNARREETCKVDAAAFDFRTSPSHFEADFYPRICHFVSFFAREMNFWDKGKRTSRPIHPCLIGCVKR